MLKSSITVQDVCDLLNEVLKLDSDFLHAITFHREKCNEAIANHPTLQVHQYSPQDPPMAGIIGLLNGMFGIREDDGMGGLCCEIDDNNKIIQFKPTLSME